MEVVPEHEDISAARRGDQTAFARLYHRYSRMVHGILLARVPRDAVDDLVQDVFLTVYQSIGSLRDPAAFGGWLARIARNRATDHHRRSREAEELDERLAIAPDVETAQAEAALSAIRSLPEAYRETLILRLVEGMSGEEISGRTGLTPASVRVNLHRGMKMLRERLGDR